MSLQKISFEYDIPDGYRFKRYGVPLEGDYFISTKEKLYNANVY